jgi:flagellin-like protein
MKRGKKAVSPMIATVILVAIVVVLAMIIFLGMKIWLKEAVEKEIHGQIKSVQRLCSEINMQPILNEGDRSFGFSSGNIPIYAIKLKTTLSGTSTVTRYDSGDSYVEGSFSDGAIINDKTIDDYDSIEIVPILLGKGKNSGGIQEFVCPEENALVIK